VTVTVLYFASLREAAAREAEPLPAPASLAALYDALRERYGFALTRDRVRVAVDGEFVAWDATIADGAEIAFIPPVSGG
jgi:sulfur-carrier protein